MSGVGRASRKRIDERSRVMADTEILQACSRSASDQCRNRMQRCLQAVSFLRASSRCAHSAASARSSSILQAVAFAIFGETDRCSQPNAYVPGSSGNQIWPANPRLQARDLSFERRGPRSPEPRGIRRRPSAPRGQRTGRMSAVPWRIPSESDRRRDCRYSLIHPPEAIDIDHHDRKRQSRCDSLLDSCFSPEAASQSGQRIA